MAQHLPSSSLLRQQRSHEGGVAPTYLMASMLLHALFVEQRSPEVGDVLRTSSTL